MKTLTDLKRDATNGKIALELVERFGKTGKNIPERMRGIRKVNNVKSMSIVLVDDKEEESELCFKSAKLVEYDGKTLTIYDAGERDLTSQEQRVLSDLKKIKNGENWWEWEHFFKDPPCPWLFKTREEERVKGKYYRSDNNTVCDRSIRGNAILKYNVKEI